MGVQLAARIRASLDIVREACARNVSAELHLQGRNGEIVVGWARMLGWRDGMLELDQPQFASGSMDLAPNQRVTVYLHVNGKRYRFASAITHRRRRIRLNERMVVTGIALAEPTELEVAQRRADFRVSVAGTHSIKIGFHGLTVSPPGPVPLDVERFEGRLIDVSTCGVSALIDCSWRPAFHRGELFYCEFTLPGDENVVTPLCQVRHSHLIRGDAAHLVGMQFSFWEGCDMKHLGQSTGRFVVAEQRRQLQRRR